MLAGIRRLGLAAVPLVLLGAGAAYAGLLVVDAATDPSVTTGSAPAPSAGNPATTTGEVFDGTIDLPGDGSPRTALPARTPASGAGAPPATRRARPSAGQLARAAGQKVIGRYVGLQPSSAFLARIRAGHLGGVIIFGDNVRGGVDSVTQAVRRMQQAAADGGNPRLIVAIDQEGGSVKRLQALPPTRSPRAMGVAGGGVAAQEGQATGQALARMGINVNLAPVVDVPDGSSSFLGDRAYASDPGTVSAVACSFATGLRSAAVLPTLKHFPGLGAANANTDFSATTVSVSVDELRAGWAPYRRCAGKGLVMLSNAAYTGLTGTTPAVLSRSAYGALRGLGFRGVTISDDLQADAVDPIDGLAVKSTRAGLDIVLYARTEEGSALAFRQLLAEARRSPQFASLIVSDARRIRNQVTRLTNLGRP